MEGLATLMFDVIFIACLEIPSVNSVNILYVIGVQEKIVLA